MLQVLEELSVTRAKVRASRRLQFRSGDTPICAEHELFGDDALDTATNQRCYVCRKPVPTTREKAKDGRWRDMRIGGLTIAILCGDCSPDLRSQPRDRSEHPALGESAQ